MKTHNEVIEKVVGAHPGLSLETRQASDHGANAVKFTLWFDPKEKTSFVMNPIDMLPSDLEAHLQVEVAELQRSKR
jgi:hypothetical protein